MTQAAAPTWVVDAGPLADQGKRESFSWTALLAALTGSPGGMAAIPVTALHEALLAVHPDDWYLIDQTTVRGELATVVTVVDFTVRDVHEVTLMARRGGCSLGTAHAAWLATQLGVPVLTGSVEVMRDLLGEDWLIYPG